MTQSQSLIPTRPDPWKKGGPKTYEIVDYDEAGYFVIGGLSTDPVERRQELRTIIVEAERTMRAMPQADIPIIHHFAHELYAREMRAPANSLIVGRVHRYGCLNIVTGDASVLTEFGPKRVNDNPSIFSTPPGTKRMIWAHTDVAWTTVHATQKTDIEEIEKEFILPDYTPIEIDAFLRAVQ
jgi:hypothetical protein